jgi:phenylacetate-CoA ligase
MRRLARLLARLVRLERNARRSREDVLSRRDRRFRETLHRAYRETEFYPRYYRRHGLTEADLDSASPADLPPIDRETYVENFDDITPDPALTYDRVRSFAASAPPGERLLDRYVVVHSSGTTGDPTYFVYDADAWDTVLAACLRAVAGPGRFLSFLREAASDFRVAYVAVTGGRAGGVTTAREGIEGFGFDPLLVDVNAPLGEWVRRLDAFDPHAVVSYPSALETVADLVRDGRLSLSLSHALVTGEPFPPPLRRYVESVLGADVVDLYGATESIVIGAARSADDRLYLYDDLNYVEPAGERTYLTPLYNPAQPLIRYELDDRLAPPPEEGGGRLPFSTVGGVVGRRADLLWFVSADGSEEFLHPLVVEDVEHPGLKQFQFVRRSSREFEVVVQVRPGADPSAVRASVRGQVDAILAEKGLNGVDYEVREGDIPVDPETGKRPLVRDEA